MTNQGLEEISGEVMVGLIDVLVPERTVESKKSEYWHYSRDSNQVQCCNSALYDNDEEDEDGDMFIIDRDQTKHLS